MIYLIFAQIDQPLSTLEFEKYLSQLTPEMQQKVNHKLRWEDSHLSLLGKILLDELAVRFFQRKGILYDVEYSCHGRPYVEGILDFNISHTENLVVCGLSDTNTLGVDVEKVRDVDLSLFQEVFSEKEWERITFEANAKEQFFRFWTQKEAGIKANGRGLSLPLRQLSLQEGKILIENQSWSIKEIPLKAGYICHLATDKDLTLDNIQLIEFRL
jgi:4'-phosphopantetheinyl transferase